jgi:hypothetical protein
MQLESVLQAPYGSEDVRDWVVAAAVARAAAIKPTGLNLGLPLDAPL